MSKFLIFFRFQSETSDYGSSTDIEQRTFYKKNQRSFSFAQNRRISSSSSSESDSNNMILYYYEKENYSTRKRSRRFHKKTSYENYHTKRIKISNRRHYSIKFSVDLTGQNINYSIEYHQKIIFLPLYYDFFYISWLQTYYYYLYYLQTFNRECEEKFMAIF